MPPPPPFSSSPDGHRAGTPSQAMSISVNEFWSRLNGRGGVDAARCRQWAAEYAQANQGRPPSDLGSLTSYLLSNGRLTPYQVECLLGPDSQPLRVGLWVVLRPADTPPLSRWLWVAEAMGKAPTALAYPLTELPESAARQRFLQKHQAVQAAGLQPIEIVGSDGQPPWIVSHLPEGRALSALLTPGKRLGRSEVLRIGTAIGGALSAMHRAGLVHGDLSLDRVWIGNDRSVWLLRDAAGPASSLLQPHGGWFDDASEPDWKRRLLYAAPEFTVPAQLPTAATDQYALGCLLYQLASGTPPMEAADSEALLRCHVTHTPAPLRAAVQAGSAGDPLLRALAWAMAKNAADRYADIPAMTTALSATAQATAEQAAAPGQAAASAHGASARSNPAVSSSAVSPPAVPISAGDADIGAVGSVPLAGAFAVAGAVTPAQPRTYRRRRRRNRLAPWMIGGLGFTVVILLIMVLANPAAQDEQDSAPIMPPPVAMAPQPAGTGAANGRPSPSVSGRPVGSDAGPYRLVDDPRLLWAPPSSGDPPALRMIPPGPQMVVVLRPRQILQSPEGQQLLAALQPELEEAWQRVEQRSGVPASQIEQLTLALTGSGDGWPTAALAVKLAEPQPLGTLRQQWGAEAARTPEGATLFLGPDERSDAYYLAQASPTDQLTVDAFAVGSVDQMQAVAEIEGSAIPLPRQLQQLWQSAPGDADVTVLAVPNFLFADGRQMLGQYAPRLVDPLRQLLLPDTAGMLITTTLRPHWYVEVRLSPGAGSNPAALMRNLQLATEKLPVQSEQFLLSTTPDPSWRAVALRMPQMMRAVADHARFGISDGQAVANLYLPAVAAPNVVVGTVLAANTTSGALNVAAASPAEDTALTVDQLLDRQITVRFDQQSLEAALAEIMDALNNELPMSTDPVPSAILGSDLEKDGITQNQQIRDFDQTQKPLRDVLTELVMQANPVTTVQSPTDTAQKLVWVVGPNPADPAEQAILITTRTAAQGRYQLPKEFTP